MKYHGKPPQESCSFVQEAMEKENEILCLLFSPLLSPLLSVLFTKIKHDWELDGHVNLLTIILDITLQPMQSQKYCQYAVITPQNCLRPQGLPISCWGAHTCLWFLKDPSKPEQLLHMIISLLKSNRDLFELCQMPWAVQCSFMQGI